MKKDWHAVTPTPALVQVQKACDKFLQLQSPPPPALAKVKAATGPFCPVRAHPFVEYHPFRFLRVLSPLLAF